MKKFRKKPVVVEAFLLTKKLKVSDVPKWCNCEGAPVEIYFDTESELVERIVIETLEGIMTARTGDYIIKGVQGEIYPCKPDIFEETYEVVE